MAERKFGEIPEWAKLGPVRLRNYEYRAEAYCARKSPERGGEHPTITLHSSDFQAWRDYFEQHLHGKPLTFVRLLNGSQQVMTVPEQSPEWFDPTWKPVTPARNPPDEEVLF